MAPVSRRSFLAGLIAAPVVTQALSAESVHADSAQEVDGWRLYWSGWREPAHQFARLGFWVGFPPASFQPPDGDARAICCTTTGEMQRLSALSVVNYARFDSSWPVSADASDAVFEHAKERARNAVVIWIRKRPSFIYQGRA